MERIITCLCMSIMNETRYIFPANYCCFFEEMIKLCCKQKFASKFYYVENRVNVLIFILEKDP